MPPETPENPTPTPTPIPEISPTTTQSYRDFAETVKGAFTQIDTSMANAGKGIDMMVTKFSALSNTEQSQINLSGNMATAFDLITQSVFGATKAFDVFNSSVDQSQSFSTQMKVLEGAGKLTNSVLREFAVALGASPKVLNAGADAIKTFVVEMANGADASMKLQTGFLQMMGTTGSLNDVFLEAGNGLQDLNNVLLKQSLMINEISGATGASSSQVANFYKLLGETIPGSVSQQVSGVDKMGRSYNTLQDAMTLAAGTGRNVKNVIDDMSTAWETYGLSGTDALEFTAKMSELSNKFGINLKYTESFVKANADAFKMLSDSADNGTNSFNRWFDSLRNTGLSAKQSSDIIQQMTTQMGNLTIAQKAFLSAQSGGPGGLRGAMQIENLLRQGKVDEVLQKAEQALKKQFGNKIFTQQEAETSEFAASQFVRQRQLLQSSAFGGLAKDDKQATRILEAFKSGTSPVAALKSPEGALNESLKRGEDVQSRSLSQLTRLVNIGERQLSVSSNTSLDLIQKTIGGTTRTDRSGIIDETHKSLVDYTDHAKKQLLDTSSLVKSRKEVNVDEVRRTNIGAGIDAFSQYMPDTLKEGADNLKRRVIGESGVIQERLNQPIPTNDIRERFRSRAEGTGMAVNRSLNTSNNAPIPQAQPVINQTQRQPETQHSKVDVTVKGLCISCARPVHPDPTTVAITSGTVGVNK